MSTSRPTLSPSSSSPYQATRELLRRDPHFDKVFAAVYDELHPLAHKLRRKERFCTLATGEIVNEAYLKMRKGAVRDLEDEDKIKLIAAVVMREILVDAARRRRARKRGGDLVQVTLSDELRIVVTWDEKLIDLDRRLNELGDADQRAATAVDMHLFGGCTVEEIAKQQNFSMSTVTRNLKAAMAWLDLKAEPVSASPLRKTT